MKIEIKGFDSLQKEIRSIEQRVRSLSGKVSFEQLFTTNFIRRHTDFGSMAELIDASGFSVESQEDFENIPDAEWDVFISERTRFENWEDMLQAAVDEYIEKKLG